MNEESRIVYLQKQDLTSAFDELENSTQHEVELAELTEPKETKERREERERVGKQQTRDRSLEYGDPVLIMTTGLCQAEVKAVKAWCSVNGFHYRAEVKAETGPVSQQCKNRVLIVTTFFTCHLLVACVLFGLFAENHLFTDVLCGS